jgi:multiple antibiotic resistance protein
VLAALQLWNAFLIAFTALLPLINPLGSALVLMGLVGEAPPEVYRSLARKVALNNIAFLAVVELLGSAILNFFGISLPIVQVSGGIVIASIGWAVLSEKDQDNNTTRDKQGASTLNPDQTLRSLQQKAFYPFTFPVTSGPGTLVVMLTLSARFSVGSVTQRSLEHVGLFLAVISLSALIFLCYAYAPRIKAAVAPTTVHGILRIVAFILICIGVQIAWNGFSVLFRTLAAH